MEKAFNYPVLEYDDAALAAAVVGYLGECPQAGDDLEGIMEWWLPRHQIRTDTIRVARALAWLAEHEIIEPVGDGQSYRLKREKN